MENDELLLAEELAWVKRRLAALDDIDVKLREMKCLAELARDYRLTNDELEKIKGKLAFLQGAIDDLDRETAYCGENLQELRRLLNKTSDHYIL